MNITILIEIPYSTSLKCFGISTIVITVLANHQNFCPIAEPCSGCIYFFAALLSSRRPSSLSKVKFETKWNWNRSAYSGNNQPRCNSQIYCSSPTFTGDNNFLHVTVAYVYHKQRVVDKDLFSPLMEAVETQATFISRAVAQTHLAIDSSKSLWWRITAIR